MPRADGEAKGGWAIKPRPSITVDYAGLFESLRDSDNPTLAMNLRAFIGDLVIRAVMGKINGSEKLFLTKFLDFANGKAPEDDPAPEQRPSISMTGFGDRLG